MMEAIKMKLDDKKQGVFYMMEGEESIGEMVFRIHEPNLTVYHTEVAQQAEGKGLAKKLLTTMVEYARANNLKVIPLCPYVRAQFQRNEERYGDVWMKANK